MLVDDYTKIHYLRFQFLLQEINKIYHSGNKIADIGISSFTELLTSNFGVDNVSAIVPDEDFLSNTGQPIKNINVKFYDISKSAFLREEEKFDIIIFSETMEHIPYDDVLLLKNLKNFINKRGYLLLTVPNIASFWNRIRLLSGKNILGTKEEIIKGVYGGYGHIREYTKSEVKMYIQKSGLKIIFLTGFTGYGGSSIKGRIFRTVHKMLPSTYQSQIVCLAQMEE